MGTIVGIDFGTSKSMVSYLRNGAPIIIPDFQDHQSIPSLAMVTPESNIFVGGDALNHPARYQINFFTISSIMRLLGKSGVTRWGNLQTYPQEVAALILGRLRVQAEAYCKEEVTRTVLAVPAHLDINQVWAIKEAAKIAGLEPVRLVDGATAAILAYRKVNEKKESLAAVVDFGGGTLDVSLVAYGDGLVEVRATHGDDCLGGDEFDQAIVDILIENIARDIGKSVELGPSHKLVLSEAAARAKIELSSRLDTRIYIPEFIAATGRYYDLDMSLERGTFERICDPLFERAKRILQQGLADANLKPSDLDTLLLIGGTSHIPRFRGLVSEVTGLKPSYAPDPATIVAQGAAILGGILSGDRRDIILLPASTASYSYALHRGDRVTRVLSRNTCLPNKTTKTISTTSDNQTDLTILLFQGDSEGAQGNILVGEVHLSGLLATKRGVPKIELTFDMDTNGTLFVSAAEQGTNKRAGVVIQAPNRLNDEQLGVLGRKVETEIEAFRQSF